MQAAAGELVLERRRPVGTGPRLGRRDPSEEEQARARAVAERVERQARGMARGQEASAKKHISKADWERRLGSVKLRKEDMNALIMDFLVTEGYMDSARTFQEESGTVPQVGLDAITDRMKIRRAVQAGQIEDAIDLVNDLNPEILEVQQLSFHLQQQRLIELIRQGRMLEALDFAQEYLAPQGEESPQLLSELEETMALLAFEDVSQTSVGRLMDVGQRQKTASELNAAILRSQSQDSEPRLPGLIKMMLWAQSQLDAKCSYPRLSDIVSGTLSNPADSAAGT